MGNQSLQGSNKIWAGGKHRIFIRSQIARRRYFICMEAVLFGNLDTHDRIMRLLAATANVR